MRFIKYNITKGKSARNNTTSTSSTTVYNPTVDLSGVYSRLSEDETIINDLNRQVSYLNNIASGLDNKYLRKDKSDNTDYTLTIGTARSNGFVSYDYDSSGIGFNLTETGSASEKPNYALILSGLGNGYSQINCKNVSLDEAILNSSTVYNKEIKLTCKNCFRVTNNTKGAYVLLDAGFTCGSYYQILEESLYMDYTIDIEPQGAPPVIPPSGEQSLGVELEKQGNYWKVPIMANGGNTTYNFTYVVKYNYIVPNGQVVASQAINLYIRGTDTTTTDFFGGVANKLVATPDYLQLTTNGAGIRITSQGIYRMDAQGNLTQLL